MAKILIVDDDNQTAQQIAAELKTAGHHCAVLNNGDGILEIVQKTNLDLLILDVMLLGSSGFEICRQIRRDENVYTLPIIFVSSMDDEAEIEHGLAQGADGYFSKPLNMLTFKQRIDRILQTDHDTDYKDPLTELSNNEGTRRLIQQHITRNENFALAYIELLNIKELLKHSGQDGRNKALRHLTRALRHCAYQMELDNYAFGHIGGGHFISLLPTETAEKYCKKIYKSWQKHMIRFYDSADLKRSYIDAVKLDEVLDLSVCVTFHQKGEYIPTQDLLDTVSRIHKTTYNEGQAGIHMDRRTL
jgi:DNA-binding response OmpR family regulator